MSIRENQGNSAHSHSILHKNGYINCAVGDPDYPGVEEVIVNRPWFFIQGPLRKCDGSEVEPTTASALYNLILRRQS